jgi:phage terminase large subunit-like protein
MEQWIKEAYKREQMIPASAMEIRQLAEDDLWSFARLVNPHMCYGEIHKDVYRWLQECIEDGWNNLGSSCLLLLPRAHLKSHCLATACAWVITKKPEITILYMSATSTLAEKQLFDIKNILTSSKYMRYWPLMICPEEGKREKWSSKEISVDHPKRSQEGIRDVTVAAAGLTTNTTGWHADFIVPDDVVVPENAYTEDGRQKVADKMSQMESICNPGGSTMACGTRYHPSDIYDLWKNMQTEIYDEETQELIDKVPTWRIKEHKVEVDEQYLWPRQFREDGKSFGFNINVLARIRSKYSDKTQYYAQYYNDPNDPGSNRINRNKFQYYDVKHLRYDDGWKMNGKKLNIFASIDFAFSLKRAADYSAIVVIGVDCDNNIYVLDIARFKTDKIIEYFNEIKKLHSHWGFKKIRAEVTAAQSIIAQDIKDHVKQDGMRLTVDEFRPSAKEGTKEERIAAALEHRYENGAMWHFRGGWTSAMEEELILARPKHDDIKDALASAVEIAVKPARTRSNTQKVVKLKPNKRFGGYGRP